MKRRLFLVGLLLALTIGTSYAQKYAFIDMEYILGKSGIRGGEQAARNTIETVAGRVRPGWS